MGGSYVCRGQWCREPACDHAAGAGPVPAAPRDLHDLLKMLPPGWRWSNDYSGLWREGHAMWIKSAGFGGRTEVHGSGLEYMGPLLGVLEYLRSQGGVRMMDEKTLAEIESRANAAAPGPWERYDAALIGPDGRGVARYFTEPAFIQTMDFIAAARTDVPALVAEVRRLGAENEHLKSLCVEGGHEMRRRLAGAEAIGQAAIQRAEKAGAARNPMVGPLVALNERMRLALAPFARAWNEQEPLAPGEDVDALEMHVKPSDCRRAAEALS